MPGVAGADIKVRGMLASDLKAVAVLHRHAFPGFFLERMGLPFLRQYYAALLSYPRHCALVAEVSGNVVGFAAGFLQPAEFYRHFRRQRLRLVPSIALAVIRSPSLIRGILSNAERLKAAQTEEPGCAELSSIAGFPPGLGVGTSLLEAFCSQVAQHGATSVVLTTDSAQNLSTRTFYERRGFVEIAVEQRASRRLCLYRRQLNSGAVTQAG